jgi:hypothetical protein
METDRGGARLNPVEPMCLCANVTIMLKIGQKTQLLVSYLSLMCSRYITLKRCADLHTFGMCASRAITPFTSDSRHLPMPHQLARPLLCVKADTTGLHSLPSGRMSSYYGVEAGTRGYATRCKTSLRGARPRDEQRAQQRRG